jgi:hypothetical protein
MSDRNAAWIREKIAEHSPEATADPAASLQLAHAWAALRGKGKNLFGMEMPGELADREVLCDECRSALRKWIPMLDKPTKDHLRQLMTGYTMPLV